MAASWGFVATGAIATGTSLTVPVPAGIQSGDLLVILVAPNGSAASPTAGWTTLRSGVNLGAYYKFAGSSESGVLFSGSSSSSAAVMAAYRGVGALDSVSVEATGFGLSPATSSHATTHFTDDLVISFYGTTSGANGWTLPTGVTTRVVLNGTSLVAGFLLADEDQAATGNTATRTAGLTTNSVQWGAIAAAFTAQPFMSFSDDLYF